MLCEELISSNCPYSFTRHLLNHVPFIPLKPILQTDLTSATALKRSKARGPGRRIAAKFGKWHAKLKAAQERVEQIWFIGKLFPGFLQAQDRLKSLNGEALVKFLLKVLRVEHNKHKARQQVRPSAFLH